MARNLGLGYVIVAIGGPEDPAEDLYTVLADLITKETGFKTTVADEDLCNLITYHFMTKGTSNDAGN